MAKSKTIGKTEYEKEDTCEDKGLNPCGCGSKKLTIRSQEDGCFIECDLCGIRTRNDRSPSQAARNWNAIFGGTSNIQKEIAELKERMENLEKKNGIEANSKNV